MYAIVRDGSDQHRVEEGDVVRLAYREGIEPGSELALDQVLLVGGDDGVTVGTPLVDGASVVTRVKGHVKDKKIVVYKYKRRKTYHKKQGHRQRYTEAVVETIRTA